MSPITSDELTITYPPDIEESLNEVKVEYAEKMADLWGKEAERLARIIFIQDPPQPTQELYASVYDEESEDDNW